MKTRATTDTNTLAVGVTVRPDLPSRQESGILYETPTLYNGIKKPRFRGFSFQYEMHTMMILYHCMRMILFNHNFLHKSFITDLQMDEINTFCMCGKVDPGFGIHSLIHNHFSKGVVNRKFSIFHTFRN